MINNLLQAFLDNNKKFLIIPNNFSIYLLDNILVANTKMKELILLAQKIANSDAPVLITGASGVGKEILAEFIHNNSQRSKKNFIKLNCAAIPENLMESEFFGYEPGAFTGASRSGKKGVIELAEEGTLFLDEIGEMSLNMQAKLLRILQDGTYYKVGGEKEQKANIRLISATNKNLKTLITSGMFREDLFFRINVISINIPPLKDRKEDIVLLSLYFLNYFNKKYGVNKFLSIDVIKVFLKYDWPGNVRELKNTIERLVLISNNDIITKEDLIYIEFLDEKYINIQNYELKNVFNEPTISLKEIVAEFEMNIIIKAIKRYGSIRKAAKVLKVTPSTISRKLSKYNRRTNSL